MKNKVLLSILCLLQGCKDLNMERNQEVLYIEQTYYCKVRQYDYLSPSGFRKQLLVLCDTTVITCYFPYQTNNKYCFVLGDENAVSR